MKKRIVQTLGLLLLFALVLRTGGTSWAADEGEEKSSSMQMMERVETLVYGEPGKGGLIERLNSVEKELFGRDLPGSISERHSAILNFLEIGTESQPSTLFKMGVAEWIVRKSVDERRSILRRVESMETELEGAMQYGKPLAMRVERLLSSLVADPVVFQEVILPAATVLEVKFLKELRVATSQRGDSVELALVNDLLVGKTLIAPSGSLIETYVREVKKPRRYGIPSDIRFDFSRLSALGPQHPAVAVGKASEKAAEEAQKNQYKGAGAMAGAGAAAIGGALVLGPVGLLTGLFVRGDAINIPAGTVMFVQTSDDVRVSGYPVPESLRIDPNATIQESVVPVTTTTTTTTTVTTSTSVGGQNTPAPGTLPSFGSGSGDRDTIVLPEEQPIN